MRYATKDIGDDGVDVDLPVSAVWFTRNCADAGARLGKRGLRFVGRIERTEDDFLLRGRLRGNLETDCSRCVEVTAVPVDAELAIVFREHAKPRGRRTGGDPDHVDDDDDEGEVLRVKDGIIDAGPPLREEILFALPMSPLCKPDCLGLCPVCGGNRNQTPCDCAEREKAGRSPFAALAKLRS